MYLGQRPFNTLDQIIGNTATVFQKWLQHSTYDSYWQTLAPTADQYAMINVPILTITGDYDADHPGAMSYYREHVKYGNPETKARHYLIIGPWDHPGTRTPRKEVGGLTFGDASLLDMNDLHRQWYDWTLKNGPKPEFPKKRVGAEFPDSRRTAEARTPQHGFPASDRRLRTHGPWIRESEERTAEAIEATETKLLKAFHHWASPMDARIRTRTAAIRALDLETEALSDSGIQTGTTPLTPKNNTAAYISSVGIQTGYDVDAPLSSLGSPDSGLVSSSFSVDPSLSADPSAGDDTSDGSVLDASVSFPSIGWIGQGWRRWCCSCA